ncbi:MAG: hypothetical protein ACYDG6_04130 [Thermincolia bacterium]
MAKEIVGVLARMDRDNTLKLLPAMGRSPDRGYEERVGYGVL